MTAIQTLKDQHREIEQLFKRIASGNGDRERWLDELAGMLRVHTRIEETIFYPALKEHPKAKDLVLEAYEEHDVVNMVMAEVDETPFDDETWGARFIVMKENLEHHIEEEESEMFDQCRDIFDAAELQELGVAMEARKEELDRAHA